MTEAKFSKTFIREWRKYRGISLRRLADRLEFSDDEQTLSHAQLNRIELGQQAYTQPIIEALAHAMDVSVVDLLTVNPYKEGEVVDLMRMLDDQKREMVLRMIEGLVKPTKNSG